MINSITDEEPRYQALIPVLKEYKAKVVALCMAAAGPPSSIEDRLATASRLVDRLTREGIALEKIYIDACVFPISTGGDHGPAVLQATGRIRTLYPGVHTSCGVSNVSFGLPVRKLLNEVYLIMLLGQGMDAALIDPCDEGLMARITAAEALWGRDEFCAGYLQAYRSGALEPKRA
jgi:5-methyltetrahydrofolate--homocysteine methyltransferase